MYEKDAWDSLKREQVFHEQTKQMLGEVCRAWYAEHGEDFRFSNGMNSGPRPHLLRRLGRVVWPLRLFVH